jgi:hypothetical protein
VVGALFEAISYLMMFRTTDRTLMGIHSSEIMKVCQELGCSCTLLEAKVSESVHTSVQLHFAQTNSSLPLWERLELDASVHDIEGWRHIENFIGKQPVFIFFDVDDDDSVVCLQDGSRITSILAECTGFVFYIADLEYNYLICFNDHDFLIGAGIAREWINRLRQALP